MMNQNDRIMAEPRGDKARVLSYFKPINIKRRSDFYNYVDTVFAVAPQVGIDPSIVIAQASHETDKFRSYWWDRRLNPAGIGITGDPQQNEASRAFETGEEAARAQIAHLMLYATGTIRSPLSQQDDPRYDAYIHAYGNKATATTLSELAGRWATDKVYADGIVRHGNAIFPNLGEQVIVRDYNNTIKFRGAPWTGEMNVRVNGILFRALPRTVTVSVDNLNIRQYADTTSEIIRTATRGERIDVIGWVSAQRVNNESRWWIGADHSRIWVGGTSEKPS